MTPARHAVTPRAPRKRRTVCPSCGTTKVVTTAEGGFLVCFECETGIGPRNCPGCGSENFFLGEDPSSNFVCDDCGTEFDGIGCGGDELGAG